MQPTESIITQHVISTSTTNPVQDSQEKTTPQFLGSFFFAVGANKPVKQLYFSQVMYKSKQFHEWDMFFLIVKNDPAIIKVIQNGI